jgi:hypothetical protein
MSKTQKWSCKSKDAQELRKMFEENKIAPGVAPKVILESRPDWKAKYSADKFRYGFNKIKNEVNAKRDAEQMKTINLPGNELLLIVIFLILYCTNLFSEKTLGIDSDYDSGDDESFFGYGDDVPTSKKQRTTAHELFSSGTACLKSNEKGTLSKPGKINTAMMNGPTDVIEGTTESGTPFTWSPIYWQLQYKNADRKNNVCVVFTLPKGVGKSGDISNSVFPSVSDDGLSLIVKCEWPDILLDTTLIQHALLNEGVRSKTVVSLCNVHSSSVIVSAKIPLKVVCENKIPMVLPVGKENDDGLIVIVMLKAKEEEEKVLFPLHNMDIRNYSVQNNVKKETYASYKDL